MLRHFRVVRRGLTANVRMAMVAACALDGLANHLLDARIAFVEVEGHDVRIAIDAERLDRLQFMRDS